MDKKTKKIKAEERKALKSKIQSLADVYKERGNDILGECDRLIVEIAKERAQNKKSATLDELLQEYEAVLRVIEENGLYDHSFPEEAMLKYYPDYKNADFNNEVFRKKEFYLHKGNEIAAESDEEVEQVSKKMCDPLFDSITGSKVSDKSQVMFNLTNSQKFLKTFMSPKTPYNSLLIFHGTGVGKTCTSISIAEQYIEDLQREGKKVIILLNQSIRDNFVKNIFNVHKVKSEMPYYQCTGESYLKHIPNYKNMTLEEIQRKILKLIKSRYDFYGYQKFANLINNLEKKIYERFDEEVAPFVFEKKIKDLFSNTVLIVDEAHNIKEGDSLKMLPPILEKIVKIADNLKLLLLTATPMFDNATEIIWLVNLLRMNQRMPTLKMETYFKDGQLIKSKIPDFKQKIRGIISYVRGENPFRFPKAVYATGSCTLSAETMPKQTIEGERISSEDQIKELVLVNCKMNGLQKELYQQMIESPDAFGAFKQPGLMCSNIVFPNSDTNALKAKKQRKSKKSGSASANNASGRSANSASGRSANSANRASASANELVLANHIGDRGFNQIVEKTMEGERLVYNINEEHNVFRYENLPNFSTKIAKIVKNVKKSDGVVFIYSQFINSGVVPIALALEHAGYSKYGGSLLKKEVRPSLGKYIIISGSRELSKNAYRNYLKVENENKDGKRIKVIIGSESASEGLDFRFIRSIHILEPWFHLNKIDQVIGRGIRNCSHIDLPAEKRNVTIYYYCSTNPDLPDRESLDISIYREAEKKSRNMAEVEYIIKTNAVDCQINKYNNRFFTDKDGSRKCNYEACDFECDGIANDEISEADLNFDTINKEILKDATEDVAKILKYGNNKNVRLFSRDSIFSLKELLEYIDMDFLVSLLGIHKLIVQNESILDKWGRACSLKYKNGYYVLIPKKLEGSAITSGDLRLAPFKRSRKLELVGSNILKYLKGEINIQVDKERGTARILEKKTLKRIKPKLKESQNTKGAAKANAPMLRTVNGQKLLDSYKTSLEQIVLTVSENSSDVYLNNVIENNASKEIFDKQDLKDVFKEFSYHWLDYIEPVRKRVLCEGLILKHHFKQLSPEEQGIFKELYNILYESDLGKQSNKTVWGYKIATLEKKMEYIRFDKDTESFSKATEEEVQAIQRTFLKRKANKHPQFYDPNILIGFVELKLPQKIMIFKIRDKTTESKSNKTGKVKGTQVKTGSICNNDGMKKPTIINFINVLLDRTVGLAYENVGKKMLPGKDLLCLQLESYFRYYDKEAKGKMRYFYNYEESLEFKLTKKK